MDLTRGLQAEEARAVVIGLTVADGSLPPGRELYYELVGSSRTIRGLFVDCDDDGVTLADVSSPQNTHHKLPWDEVISVTVRSHGLRR